MVGDECWDIISYVMGCTSVFIWLCAQMPQILKNWRRKSVEGLSPGFLAAWIAGDASNLVGCVMTGQLGVQILLASYYCVVDVVLITQFLLYRPRAVYVDGFDPSTYGALDGESLDNSNQLRKGRSKSLLGRMYEKFGVAVGLATLAQPSTAAPVGLSVHATVSPFEEPRNFMWSLDSDSTKLVGFFVAYFSMAMYLTSRLPQILHNFQRKSTTGISMILFMCALLGNLTYTFSILLAPQSMGSGANRSEFLLNELPYLIGAAGTMLFDCIILGQWYWYQRLTAHRRRSTQVLDRMSRPYLGSSHSFSQIPTPSYRATGTTSNASAQASRIGRNSSKLSRHTSWQETTPLLQDSYVRNGFPDESAVEDN